MQSDKNKTSAPKSAEVKKPANKTSEPSGVFVYLGPTIRGVISHAAILTGTRSEVCARFADVIAEYPAVGRLIVADCDVAAAKKKIKEGGNLLAKAHADLLRI